ncbi:rod-binding protein [Cereibacter sphaeroides]|uniref:rod-binding protein n=1 Tax=Rhodobacterales TaxID=204455 RepID=UPI000BBF1B17|nr:MULTISPECIES: rod-binding protein [Paracoccaceae]MCE6952384.1 rod-binding protein [Cereibacter sphaeroides]MCE6960921.1 rod-binding protein [Cereibacter sphaeroides]MCE6969781.1 rod-binding protein [Cereibacter sphaeroides]MCE6975256.1 rod-binding protein [Cereibacter sphaeroides]
MSVTITSLAAPPPDPKVLLRRKAEELEAAFLSEMLGHTGMGATSEAFGGGIGESQFASLLRHEQATGMVRAGGIGLAEQFYRSLAGESDSEL